MPRKGTPYYLLMAQRAANLRFVSTAQARIPHWPAQGRVKRSDDVKRQTEEKIRAVSQRVSPEQRRSFFRAYKTLVAGRTQALETAERIYRKHASQLTSPDYRIHRKAVLAFRNELLAAAGKENAGRVIEFLKNSNLLESRRTPPVFRSEAKAFELVENHKPYIMGIISSVLGRVFRNAKLKQESDEMYADIVSSLALKIQRFDESVGASLKTALKTYVRESIADRQRELGQFFGFYRRGGRAATVESIESVDTKKDAYSLADRNPRTPYNAELRADLVSAIQRLTPEQQTVFVARLFDERTFLIIGKSIGKTENQAQTIYRNALHRVRGFLAKHSR